MPRLSGQSSLGASEDTYFYQLARSSLDTYAVISSDDCLRLFDADSLKLHSLVHRCNEGVSCLQTSADGTSFITAGRDAKIQAFDNRGQGASLSLVEPRGAGFSALACREHYIAAGTESTKEGLGDVSVLIYDTRNPSGPLRQYSESHTDSITQLKFHPTQPQCLLSGSTDGLVSLFNVNEADEDDALQQVLNPRAAVHCAGFLANEQVYVFTTDENFSIYDISESQTEGEEVSTKTVADFGDVRQQLDCMYVVDVLQEPGSLPIVAYGHNEKQTLSLMTLEVDKWGDGHPVNLPGGHGEEVCRDILMNGQQAVSCGEDGQIRVWSLDHDSTARGPTSGDRPVKSKSEARKQKKAERYAPY